MVKINSEILLRGVSFVASKMQQLANKRICCWLSPTTNNLACLCPSPFQVLDPLLWRYGAVSSSIYVGMYFLYNLVCTLYRLKHMQHRFMQDVYIYIYHFHTSLQREEKVYKWYNSTASSAQECSNENRR